jgi:hypothetical protein
MFSQEYCCHKVDKVSSDPTYYFDLASDFFCSALTKLLNGGKSSVLLMQPRTPGKRPWATSRISRRTRKASWFNNRCHSQRCRTFRLTTTIVLRTNALPLALTLRTRTTIPTPSLNTRPCLLIIHIPITKLPTLMHNTTHQLRMTTRPSLGMKTTLKASPIYRRQPRMGRRHMAENPYQMHMWPHRRLEHTSGGKLRRCTWGRVVGHHHRLGCRTTMCRTIRSHKIRTRKIRMRHT